MSQHLPGQEPTASTEPFRWRTPFGLAVGLFMGYGVLNLVVATVVNIWVRRAPGGVPMGVLMINERADTELFGDRPSHLVKRDPALALLRRMDFAWMSGSWMSFGIIQMALTWFGLRRKQRWAFWALVAGDLSILPYWAQVFEPYRTRGIRLLPTIPPLFLYPAFLLPPASLLAWLELRKSYRSGHAVP